MKLEDWNMSFATLNAGCGWEMSIDNISQVQTHNDRVLVEIDKMRTLFTKKNNTYHTSPVEILPTESWLHQIRIKAERALQANSQEKMKDELFDCAVYCVLLLAKIENANSVGKKKEEE